MAQHPVLNTSASIAVIANAETTIVNNLPAVLGKARLPINGKIMTTLQAVAVVQSHLDAIAHVANLRAQLKAAIKAEDVLRATIKAAVICIRGYVAAAYGEQSTQYASLGFEPRKPAHKTAKTKAEAVDKALATRTARHTMGKQQRAKIFGDMPAGAPGAQPAMPAPSAASATVGAGPASVPSTGNGTAVAAANATGSTTLAFTPVPAIGTSGHRTTAEAAHIRTGSRPDSALAAATEDAV